MPEQIHVMPEQIHAHRSHDCPHLYRRADVRRVLLQASVEQRGFALARPSTYDGKTARIAIGS